MASPIPKAKEDKVSDSLERVQGLGWQKKLNENTEVSLFLQDEKNVEKLNDYIFGKTEENPLEEIRNKYQ